MSPPASNCVETPILLITIAPSPKKRIFIPFNSSTLLIFFLNQPEVSGACVKQLRALRPYSP